MKQPHKNSLLALAIVSGLLSLPTTWMTIHGAQFQGGFGNMRDPAFGEMFNPVFGQMKIDVTGLNGHFTFLVETPIWFITLVAIAASIVQLMRGSKIFAIPAAVEWSIACVAVGWVGLAIITALFSGKASLGIGSILGLFSAATPLAVLFVPSAATENQQ